MHILERERGLILRELGGSSGCLQVGQNDTIWGVDPRKVAEGLASTRLAKVGQQVAVLWTY